MSAPAPWRDVLPVAADLKIGPHPSSGELGSPAPQNLKFEREDWSLFRTVEGLQQKAGVAKAKLPRLVLKELTDNGLDEGAEVRIGSLPKSGYFVEDDGHGIDGTPEQIAQLFSIARPMVSTKLLRLPTRGALGNGLRVVAGAVLASEGSLVVTTRNRRIALRPERDGSTTVVSATAVEFPVGTRVEITFGAALPCNSDTLDWSRAACLLAGQPYAGRSSPWWYDVAQFHELLYASGNRPVYEPFLLRSSRRRRRREGRGDRRGGETRPGDLQGCHSAASGEASGGRAGECPAGKS